MTSNYQIGCVVRNQFNDSLCTAKGMRSWLYGAGVGGVIPIAGPLWINLNVAYQYNNYRMLNNDKSILGQVERLQKHKLAMHTLLGGGYLRLSTSKNKPLQGKFIEFGFNYGWNFSNRLIQFQGIDPNQAYGAHQIKTKYKNVDFFSKTSQNVCVRLGREQLALFAEYRISDFFRRSEHVNANQKLPELSRLIMGIAILFPEDAAHSNTDETGATTD